MCGFRFQHQHPPDAGRAADAAVGQRARGASCPAPHRFPPHAGHRNPSYDLRPRLAHEPLENPIVFFGKLVVEVPETLVENHLE